MASRDLANIAKARYGELLKAGIAPLAAYCEATGKPDTKAARETASRWKRDPVVLAVINPPSPRPVQEVVVSVSEKLPFSRDQMISKMMFLAMADNADESPQWAAVQIQAMRSVFEWMGWQKPEKDEAEDLGALVRRLIKPTPGLHGEHVNHVAMEAQQAMKSPA